MNRVEHVEHAKIFARDQLATLEKDAQLLRSGGHVKEAERAEREVVRARQRAERLLASLPAKLDASDARLASSVDELIAEIERNLARAAQSSADQLSP